MITRAPCTIAWAILPAAILPSGTSTSGVRPAFAAYAAIEAEVLPVDAQTTASAPSALATEMAVVMPRSLKDPVGLLPSTLSHTSAPVSPRQPLGPHQRRAALAQGDRLSAGGDRSSSSRYSSITPRHWCGRSTSGHSSPPSTRITEVTSRTMSMPRRCSTVAASWASVARVGDDDELRVVAAALLADGLDRHAVLGEGRGHRGEHARAVVDVDGDVVAGDGSPPSAAPRGRRTPTRRRRGCRRSRLRATVTRSPSTARRGRASRRRRGRRTSAARPPRTRRRPR